MKIVHLLGAAAICAQAATAGAAWASADGAPRRLAFDVYLDDARIGEHRFVLEARGDAATVLSEADFAVKLVFFTAYAYEHRNREVWRDGCLVSIDAFTDDNGERSAVSGAATEEGFVLRTDGGARRLGSCVRSFAYWDRGLLDAGRLLNAQTGEHVAVDLEPLGQEQLELGGETVPVERYALEGDGVDITLSYHAATGAWVALDTGVDGGRTLRYRLQRAPVAAASPQATRDRAG
jgi:hypothetical protein